MWRRYLALVVSAIYVVGVVFAALLLLKPAKPPDLPKAAVVHPALTKHLLFVVVDGLRYDIATDPARMPHFAEAMQRQRSADILAGTVSMTSSAVQAFASGQRGRVEQVARNLNPDPPPFQSWMQNARERGLKVALVGDLGWHDMFGRGFDEMRLDPPGAAIDYDFNAKTFADAREILGHAPDAVVLHFVTPDHQGHAYGVQSERYRKHIFNFDRSLFELLAEVPPDWTVVVTSDHGANDAGDHGGDVLVHRRSPIFAYGPGIAPKSADSPQLDQIDVAGTLSALLGVPAPCHSQGHLLVDWLDLPDPERANIALNDVARLLALASRLDPDESAKLAAGLAAARSLPSDPRAQIREARRLASAGDTLLKGQQGIFSRKAWWTLGAVALGSALVVWLWLAPLALPPVVLSLLIALLAVLLTAFVEKLPGTWPTRSAGLLFGLFNLPTLLLLLRPERFVSWLAGFRAFAPALVPGVLAVVYPRDLLPEAYAVVLVIALVVLGGRSPERWGLALAPARPGRTIDLLLLAVWGCGLLPAGVFPDGLMSLSWGSRPHLVLCVSVALLASALFELLRQKPRAAREIAWLVAAVFASLAAKRFAPPWLGRSALLLLPLSSIWPLLRRRLDLALLCLLSGYLWVSRDIEVPTLAAALGLASLVGRRSAQRLQLEHHRARFLTLLAFWFALAFVLRLGLGGGIDPTHLDLSAGAFGDAGVPTAWVAFCIVWKNLIAQTLVGVAFVAAWPERAASRLTRGLAAVAASRPAVLLAMMLLAQGSFWTSMRVVGELPYSLILFVVPGLAWLAHYLARAEPHAVVSSETESALGAYAGQAEGL